MNDRQLQETGAFLRQGEWFAGLPPALQGLILQRSILRSYAKGHTIQVEDSPAPGLVVVLDGQISILRHVGDDEPALIHVAGPGFWFGELAVFVDEAIVTVVAQTAVKAMILPKREFDRIVGDEPRHYPAFVQILCTRFQVLLRYFAETIRLSPEYRLRLRLASLADTRRGETKTAGRAVFLDISQAELAETVGLSRQRLNSRLKALEKEGWIELSPRRIRVLDPNGLRATAVGEFAPRPVTDRPARKTRPTRRPSAPADAE